MEPHGLRAHPFARTLETDQLERLVPCAREVDFQEGAFVFREGEDADTLYLIRSGCVALEQHVPGMGVTTVENVCAGDILGLSWLFLDAHWTLDARCVEPVRAVALEARCILERMREDPALGVEILTHVTHALYHRLMRVRLQRLDVYRAGR